MNMKNNLDTMLQDCQETVESLKAENARLRDALEQIANATLDDTPNVVAEDFIAIAKQALEKKDD